ncbi:protein takeout-like [Musca autumnalis]|uniref:protein takeout-like n=1 Tax=Musca autumnalis TaxID=221902 RepID=UPI003CEF71FC
MEMIRLQSVGILFFALTATVLAKEYLSQKPDFIHPCKTTDPGFKKCFAKDFQVIFVQYKDGIPGLKNFGSIDPLHVKRVKVAEDGNGPVSINIELTNMEVHGFSKTIVTDANFDPKKLITRLKFALPEVKIISDYTVNGRVLTLPLNGHGQTRMEIKNLEIDVICKLKRRDEGGVIFSDIDKVIIPNLKVNGFHIEMDNLFNGNVALEQSAHTLFNENWRDFYETLRPSITETIRTVMEDRYKKVFAFVPARYYIEDFQ